MPTKKTKVKTLEDDSTVSSAETTFASSSTPSITLPTIVLDPSPPLSSASSASSTSASSIPPAAPASVTTKYCRVAECRFALSHVTSAHRCGQCGLFGHGVIECNDQAAKDKLISFTGDRLPPAEQCTVVGCRFRHSHTVTSHQCGKCEQYGHSAMACPRFPLSAPNPLSAVPGHFYKSSAKPSTDPTITFLCPICRVSNTVCLSQPNVYNVEVDCVVCNDAKAQVFNVNCGHVCLCWTCAKDLK